jgi:hypothetical protein
MLDECKHVLLRRSSTLIAAIRSLSVLMVLCLFGEIGAAATPKPPQSTIEIRALDDVDGTLILRSVLDPSIVIEIVMAGKVARLGEAARSEWQMSLKSETWWSPPRRITFPGPGSLDVLAPRFWRSGIVKGRVAAGQKDLDLPKTIKLAVESPPNPSRKQQVDSGTEFQCPVMSDGSWSCRLPALVLDLALRSPGMTPHYRWDVLITSERPKDLGTFSLRKGASVTAWLDRETLRALKEPAHARLVRPIAHVASPETARLEVPVAQGSFDRRGVLQLAPIPAGVYMLEISAKGFAAARIGPLEVYEGKEVRFRKAIELNPPLSVVVLVNPARDVDGSPWRISLDRKLDFSTAQEPKGSGYANEQGSLTFTDQAPGSFSVTVLDRVGNRVWTGSQVVQDEVTAKIQAKLNLETVKGIVRLGSEPLCAKLWFGGRDGAERTALQSDDHGAFEGRLRPGRWQVQVQSDDPFVNTIVAIVIDKRDEPVKIDLPDTEVVGSVVDSRGERVARGTLTIFTPMRVFVIDLPSDGTFTLHGLSADAVQLMASDRRTGEESATISLQFTAGKRIDGLQLRTEARREITGIAVSRGSPVIGAEILGWATDGGETSSLPASTDLEGRFSFHLRTSARRAKIIVSAPGRTLQCFLVPIADDPLRLEVAPVGGTVEIERTSPFRFFQNGIELPIGFLIRWINGHGIDLPNNSTKLTIPDLAPGQYEACTTPNPGKLPICRGGQLAPGGSLTLDLSE